MRSRVALVLCGVAFLLGCQSTAVSPSANPLQGTWELVSGSYADGDNPVQKFDSSTLRSMKVLNETHFEFISMSAPDRKFIRAGGGTYRIDGNRYFETVRYASSSSMLDQTYEFTMRLDGDTWYHNGSVGARRLEEVWRRVR